MEEQGAVTASNVHEMVFAIITLLSRTTTFISPKTLNSLKDLFLGPPWPLVIVFLFSTSMSSAVSDSTYE